MSLKNFAIFIACLTILFGCSKEIIIPELFGSIEGQVLDSETNEGLANVNITTNPATNSILTDQDGTFQLNDLGTGNYSVTAKKPGYGANSVSVTVRENQAATAQMYLEDAASNSSQYIVAEVTSWEETSNGDSTFAEVEYRVINTSEDSDIGNYEIYFGIYTSSGSNFFHELRDSSLAAREQSIGSFKKYVRQTTIDSVTVTDTWTSD